ncbi:hypothetical protein LTS18_014617 [Coniosporium uncinatum]|uniref:Uncharacterized protein n=1 Tax=Coniosporium uncinatum TaxID=93489 RepID=A0ACC3D8V9_9PEZI|nr:hypothetical protein LTS18_014617 [Coniosporium uncinatum]
MDSSSTNGAQKRKRQDTDASDRATKQLRLDTQQPTFFQRMRATVGGVFSYFTSSRPVKQAQKLLTPLSTPLKRSPSPRSATEISSPKQPTRQQTNKYANNPIQRIYDEYPWTTDQRKKIVAYANACEILAVKPQWYWEHLHPHDPVLYPNPPIQTDQYYSWLFGDEEDGPECEDLSELPDVPPLPPKKHVRWNDKPFHGLPTEKKYFYKDYSINENPTPLRYPRSKSPLPSSPLETPTMMRISPKKETPSPRTRIFDPLNTSPMNRPVLRSPPPPAYTASPSKWGSLWDEEEAERKANEGRPATLMKFRSPLLDARTPRRKLRAHLSFGSPMHIESPDLATSPVLKDAIQANTARHVAGGVELELDAEECQEQQDDKDTTAPDPDNDSIDVDLNSLLLEEDQLQYSDQYRQEQAAIEQKIKDAEAAKKKAEELRKAEELKKAAEEEQRRLEAEREVARIRAEEEANVAALTKSVLVDISPEWNDKLDYVMAKRSDEANATNKGLTRRDFATCLPTKKSDGTGWLNDEVINKWMGYLVQAPNEASGYVQGKMGGEKSPVPPYQFLTSFWYSSIRDKGVSSVARWSQRARIEGEKLFKVKKLFIPINDASHWTLLIISGTERTIEYCDSYGGVGEKYTDAAKAWLKAELRSKYVEKEWTVKSRRSALQTDSYACGAFTCMNAMCAMKDVDSVGQFKQGDMPHVRRQILVTLMNEGFTNEFAL